MAQSFNRLVEYQASSQEAVISRVLILVHQAIDEHFPQMANSERRFSKTAFSIEGENTSSTQKPDGSFVDNESTNPDSKPTETLKSTLEPLTPNGHPPPPPSGNISDLNKSSEQLSNLAMSPTPDSSLQKPLRANAAHKTSDIIKSVSQNSENFSDKITQGNKQLSKLWITIALIAVLFALVASAFVFLILEKIAGRL